MPVDPLNHEHFEQKPTMTKIFNLSQDLVNMVDELDIKADSLKEFVRGLLVNLGWSVPGSHPCPTSSRSGSGTAEGAPQIRKAEPSVNSLSLIFKPGGKAILQIEGRQQVLLAPRLGALMAALTVNDRPSPDGLIAWRSDKDILADIQRRTGKQQTRNDFKQLIYLLRRELKQHGENPWLVMRHAKLGSRFALQRGGKVFVTNDSHK